MAIKNATDKIIGKSPPPCSPVTNAVTISGTAERIHNITPAVILNVKTFLRASLVFWIAYS